MNVIELQRPSAHVAEVWLNRPEVRNAFNEELIAALTQTFAALSAEPGLRVIVLGARGKAFCAGADLNWMRAMAQATDVMPLSQRDMSKLAGARAAWQQLMERAGIYARLAALQFTA